MNFLLFYIYLMYFFPFHHNDSRNFFFVLIFAKHTAVAFQPLKLENWEKVLWRKFF